MNKCASAWMNHLDQCNYGVTNGINIYKRNVTTRLCLFYYPRIFLIGILVVCEYVFLSSYMIWHRLTYVEKILSPSSSMRCTISRLIMLASPSCKHHPTSKIYNGNSFLIWLVWDTPCLFFYIDRWDARSTPSPGNVYRLLNDAIWWQAVFWQTTSGTIWVILTNNRSKLLHVSNP